MFSVPFRGRCVGTTARATATTFRSEQHFSAARSPLMMIMALKTYIENTTSDATVELSWSRLANCFMFGERPHLFFRYTLNTWHDTLRASLIVFFFCRSRSRFLDCLAAIFFGHVLLAGGNDAASAVMAVAFGCATISRERRKSATTGKAHFEYCAIWTHVNGRRAAAGHASSSSRES